MASEGAGGQQGLSVRKAERIPPSAIGEDDRACVVHCVIKGARVRIAMSNRFTGSDQNSRNEGNHSHPPVHAHCARR
eukprot:CAMPEP_0176027932 /NCGR_PEP_ID=MMETSP0120_2-20121206/13702_1 /TAXON_ID=160619 /ORGANISM="Kryptoperidinium foliaceum, Strain CCMP 1326" /LENGTH=76 /DNA_ID=CAMNT_0017361137 /DNA_START=415 /DNA_END=645 /DNA_ORIENTATION=-